MGVDYGRAGATLLFPEKPALRADTALVRFNGALAPFGLHFMPAVPATPNHATWTNGAIRVSVTVADSPADPASLGSSLTGSYTRIRPNDYASRIAAHAARMQLHVHDDRPQHSDPIPDATMIVIAHAALVALVATSAPLVIHWHDTNILILPSEVPPVRGIGFPASLATRPKVAPAGHDARGRRRFRIAFEGSERFFGKQVRVEPTAHPMDEVLSLVDFCLLRQLAGEELLSDGARLGLPGPVEVLVRHLPPATGADSGIISLSLRAILPRLSTGSRDRLNPNTASPRHAVAAKPKAARSAGA